ncbi:MAG: tetratricopeptide repeat protein, partial [Polyangiales bacterium]
IQATFGLGRFKEGLPRSEALYVRAKKLGYHPLEAEVGLLYGQLQNRSGDLDGAAATFLAALVVATGSKHDEVALRLAVGLVLAAASKNDYPRGHDWISIASGFVERLGEPPLRRAIVYYGTGYLLSAEGKYPASAVAYEHALEIRERLAPGTQDLARTLNSLAYVYDEIGRYKEARAVGERSLALQQAELGPAHPEVATVLTNLGNIASDEGDLALALKYYERCLVIREKTVPAGDDPSLLANVINNLGTIAQDQKRYDDALALHRRALAIRETIDPMSGDVAMSLVNIAAAQRSKGDHTGALAEYRKSLVIAELRLGKDHPYVGDALYGIGDCTWESHSLDESQAALERALAIRKLGARPIEVAEVEFALARTVWDRGQHARANELAESARTMFASTDAGKTRLVELDEWRRAHVTR